MKKILLFIVLIETIFILFLVYHFRFYPDLSFLKTDQEPLVVMQDLPSPTPFVLGDMEIVGWFAAWDSAKATDSLPAAIGSFTELAPMFYRIMPDSSLGLHNFSTRNYLVQQANAENIPLLPIITDESDPDRVQELLDDGQVQKDFIDELVSVAKEENYAGWSIDIESLKSQDKQAFSQFIKNVYTELHANDLKLYVVVYGREENEKYDPALAHDYATLGKYSDQIQVMTYNYNNDFTGPGGQAPLEWYRKVLEYATKSVPREKILVGLSTHGYDWHGDETTGLTYPEVEDLIEANDAKVTYNPDHSAKVASYTTPAGVEHEIWFEDADTITEKMEIARNEFGINKFAFWRTSAEDPRLYMEVEKLNP